MMTRILTTHGQRVAIHDFAGDTSGSPAIFFIHGLGSSSMAAFGDVLDPPALRRFRRVLVDLPGFGESANEAADYSIEGFADLVASIIDVLVSAPVTLIGHSMGGSVAICVAGRHPDLIARLIVAEPNLGAGTGVFSGQVTRMSEQRFVSHGRDAIVRGMNLAANRGDTGAARFASTVSSASALAIHRAARSLRAERSPTFREMLIGLSLPRLYIAGGASDDADAVGMGMTSSGIELEIIPTAGHVMMVDAPAAFAAIVIDFIRKTHGS